MSFWPFLCNRLMNVRHCASFPIFLSCLFCIFHHKLHENRSNCHFSRIEQIRITLSVFGETYACACVCVVRKVNENSPTSATKRGKHYSCFFFFIKEIFPSLEKSQADECVTNRNIADGVECRMHASKSAFELCGFCWTNTHTQIHAHEQVNSIDDTNNEFSLFSCFYFSYNSFFRSFFSLPFQKQTIGTSVANTMPTLNGSTSKPAAYNTSQWQSRSFRCCFIHYVK